MRTRIGVAGIAVVVGCLGLGACNTEPTGVHTEPDHNYSVGQLPAGEGYVGNGSEGGGEATTQSDTTQRGIGGFGSGN